jgi:hypothetical protein
MRHLPITVSRINYFSGSCRADFETIPSTGDLVFSRDTVYLDTVLLQLALAPTD